MRHPRTMFPGEDETLGVEYNMNIRSQSQYVGRIVDRFSTCPPRNRIVLVHLLLSEPLVFSFWTDMRAFDSVLTGTDTAASIAKFDCLRGVRPRRSWRKWWDGQSIVRKPPCWRQIVVWKGPMSKGRDNGISVRSLLFFCACVSWTRDMEVVFTNGE